MKFAFGSLIYYQLGLIENIEEPGTKMRAETKAEFYPFSAVLSVVPQDKLSTTKFENQA